MNQDLAKKVEELEKLQVKKKSGELYTQGEVEELVKAKEKAEQLQIEVDGLKGYQSRVEELELVLFKKVRDF